MASSWNARIVTATIAAAKLLPLESMDPMATIRFTQNIQRHVPCPTREAEGSDLRSVLDCYFRENERARGYVLDEQGKIRQHMVVFIDGEMAMDREKLSDRVRPGSVIDVIQSLSGG
jgi:molybdopterin synthase sulfur carrier subunit